MRSRVAHWTRWMVAVAAHYTGVDALYRRASGAGLVVLMLHRLRDRHDPYPLSLRRDSFRRMVGWLRERDALVGLDDGLRALDGTGDDGALRYAITFDDGYRDNLWLLDASLGTVPAVVYVVTSHVGGEPIWVYRLHAAVEARTRDRLDLQSLGLGGFDLADADDRQRLYDVLPPALKALPPEQVEAHVDAVAAQTRPRHASDATSDMLDWPEIRRLHDGGVQIGAHTRHHVLLGRVDARRARDEIRGSRGDIAERLDAPPAHFAYPNGGRGDFGDRDVALVRDAGFRTAVTSIEGVNRPGADRYRLLRHNVHEQRFRAPLGQLSRALFFSETSGLLGWLRERRAA